MFLDHKVIRVILLRLQGFTGDILRSQSFKGDTLRSQGFTGYNLRSQGFTDYTLRSQCLPNSKQGTALVVACYIVLA